MTTRRYEWIELAPGDADPQVTTDAGVTPVPAVERRHHAPDRTLLLVQDDALVARCSCWWTSTPLLDGQRTGLIGHYAAADDASARALLERACTELKARGAELALGPMDGTTWRRYRLVVERGDEPPFVLEPDNPDEWPAHWRLAGFDELAGYTSALVDPIPADDPRTTALGARVEHAGISIRTIDLAHVDRELDRIFTLSLQAFSDNFLYTPISHPEFLAQYHAVLPHVHPELVLLAEHDGELVGFMFALPNVIEARSRGCIATVIMKTLAVAPSARGSGLGTLLVARVQHAARALGMSRAIHALMHEENLSRRISDHGARTIRRYALFGRRLTP